MRIGEVAERAGATLKAVRYYEELGLIAPSREANGYRAFDERDVRSVREIRALAELGIGPGRAAPFLECLDLGHPRGDECVSSLAVYRDEIAELDRAIAGLSERRARLQDRLDRGAEVGFPAPATESVEPHRTEDTMAETIDFSQLPKGLPVPRDDGGAAHLPGLELPELSLPTSDGGRVDLGALGAGRTILYLYPMTGRPGVDLPEGWDAIPGARGCSTEACDFRDHFAELRDAGAERVFGLSSQDPEYQGEVCERLRLPFPMISDESFALAAALRLPTFAAQGHERLYSRLTLVVREGVIEHVFYPIFPPNEHARQVLAWLTANPVTA